MHAGIMIHNLDKIYTNYIHTARADTAVIPVLGNHMQ